MMLPALFLSIFTIVLTTSALPTALTNFNLLVPRFDWDVTPSSCVFDPHFLGYKTKAFTSQPAKALVTITDKTTPEKGDIGSGLHNNLLGECGHDQITQWQTPSELSKKRWSNEVAAYSVWFNVGSVTDPACIQRAIKKAEGQDVACTVV